MRQVVFLMVFLAFALPALTRDVCGQELYKWVDEKGTVHFSDNPVYARSQQQKEYSKENGIEVLKKKESNNSHRPVMDRSGKRMIINYSQGPSPGIGSYGGGTTTTYSSGSS